MVETMEIENDRELTKIVNEVNERLQAIQNYCGIKKTEEAKVRFPRGFIRTAAFHRKKLPSGLSPLLRHNISYSLMTLDVFRWLIIRTDMSGPASSMVIKRAIAILAELMETLVKNYTQKRTFDKAVDTLRDKKIIDPTLAEDLKSVWKLRSTIHLWEAKELEHDKFKSTDYNKILVTYEMLRECLVKEYGIQPQ
jgi:hypothetical protein